MKEESWTKVMEEISDIHVVEAVRLEGSTAVPCGWAS